MSHTNNDEEDDFQEHEKDPHVERLYDVLEGTCQDLRHELKADTVTIIITCHDNRSNQTESYGAGLGNHYARIEACRNYVAKKSRD